VNPKYLTWVVSEQTKKVVRFPNPVNPDRALVNKLNLESVVNELGDILFGPTQLRKPISCPLIG
jgi:hypothetical protein